MASHGTCRRISGQSPQLRLGVYTMHSTGDSVEDPDLLASSTIQDPAPNY